MVPRESTQGKTNLDKGDTSLRLGDPDLPGKRMAEQVSGLLGQN